MEDKDLTSAIAKTDIIKAKQNSRYILEQEGHDKCMWESDFYPVPEMT